MVPGAFEYFAPRSLPEAVKFLSEHRDDVKVLSGGQSLLPLMKMRLAKPAYVVDLGRVPGLDNITEDGNHSVLGALVTHAQIENSQLLKSKCPLLPQTATTIADVQVRNRGTIGGSLAEADPSGDWATVLMTLPATITCLRAEKIRKVALSDCHYPDIDLHLDGATQSFTRKDGTTY